jgi:hypothetical protein
MKRFAVIRDWLATQGTVLSEKADVWLQQGNMSSKIANRVQDFRENTVKALIEKTQKSGFTMGQIAEYLEMKHIPEANVRMRQIHGDPDATANGVADDEANTVLDQYRQHKDFAKLEAIAKEWQGITASTRGILLESGIITSDMAKAWQATYQNYVPLKGDEEQKGSGTGKGLGVNGKTKRRLGHGDREEAVIANILRDHELAIHMSEKNAVGIALVHFAVEAQNPDLITVGKPERRQVYKDKVVFEVQYQGVSAGSFDTERAAQDFILRDAIISKRQQSSYGVAKTSDPSVVMMASPMLADNEVNVYINGHAVRVQLNDELLAQAYTMSGIDTVSSYLEAARDFNRFLSKAYTGVNPEFIFKNMYRDLIAGSVNLTGDYGVGIAAKIYANYASAVHELWKALGDDKKSSVIMYYKKQGGNTGAGWLSDKERINEDVMSSFNEYAGTVDTVGRTYADNRLEGRGRFVSGAKATGAAISAGYKKIPLFGHALKGIEHLNALTENALRVATFRTLLEQGYESKNFDDLLKERERKGLVPGSFSPEKAAMAAKMSTVNFNRKGEKSAAMGAAYLFYNPAVQGLDRFATTLASSKHKGQARALCGFMVFGSYMIAEMMRGGDDDDKKKWKETPGYVKDRNMVFDLPGGYQMTIPLPYDYGIFWALGNILSDAQHGADGWKLGIRLADAITNNLSPIGSPINEKGELSPTQMLPTALKMVVNPSINKDAFDRDLTPKKFNEAKPDSENMNRTTKGTVYAAAAKKMNSLSGGDAYHQGHVDVSPETLKYWVSALTGGAGKFAMDSAALVSNIAQGVEPSDLETRELPIVRSFVREAGVSDSRQLFYDHVEEAKKSAAALAFAIKAQDTPAAQGIAKKELPEITVSKYADGYFKVLSDLSDQTDKLRNNDKLSLAEKRLKMKGIERKAQAVYDEFDKVFEKNMGKSKP